MFLQAIQCLEDTHPQYVQNLKAYYYSRMLGILDWLVDVSPSKEKTEIMNALNSYRKKVNFTKKEWQQSTIPQKIRCICSLPGLNIISIQARHLLSKFNIIKN